MFKKNLLKLNFRLKPILGKDNYGLFQEKDLLKSCV